jgi:hypothetical protein
MSRVSVVSIRRGMDGMVGCIDTLYTPLRNTINYSAIADLYTLQFTVTHQCTQSSLVVSWERIYNSLTAAHIKSSYHSLISFLPSLFDHLRLPSRYIASGADRPKTPFPSFSQQYLSCCLFVAAERVYRDVA